MLHEVRYGETLTDIAAHYDVATTAITSFAPNHIQAADDITEQQVVFVPNANVTAAATATATPNTPTATSSPGDTAAPTDVPTDTSDPPATDTPDNASSSGGGIVGGGPRSGHGLIWPVVGPISSYYGPSHPLGIDIDARGFAPSPENYSHFALTVKGLVIGFVTEQVAGGSCGAPEVIVPYGPLRAQFSKLGERLVAGVRRPVTS